MLDYLLMTNITAAGETINELETLVNSDLENLRKWLSANKLSLNATKAELIDWLTTDAITNL